MHGRDERRFWWNPRNNIRLMHASLSEFAFPMHSHEQYTISLIDKGAQSFTHKGSKHYTAPGGIILINPDELHTGEAARDNGFEVRSLYPSIERMQQIAQDITGKTNVQPHFQNVLVYDDTMQRQLLSLHEQLKHSDDPLAIQSLMTETLALLVTRHADLSEPSQQTRDERRAVRLVRDYIDAHFADPISLNDLAKLAALSPYYLLRVFRAEVGVPPNAYLQTVRIRAAQRLIEMAMPLADVALAVGFNSQSHLNRRFRPILGLTPGQYATQVRP